MQQPVAPFSVRIASQSGGACLALRGELDMSVIDLFKEPLAKAEADGVSSIVLDLRDLVFMDSTGLHAILGAWRRAEANGHQLHVVVGASQAARRVFEITGTEFLIDETGVSSLDGFTDGHRSGLAREASGGHRDV